MTAPHQLPADPRTEQEIWRGKPSHYYFAGAWVAGLILLPVGVGLLIILRILWVRAGTRYVLTNLRAMVQSGIFIRSSNEVRLSDVRSINVQKRGLSGLLSIGTLELATAASDRAEVSFVGISQVEEVRDLARSGQAGSAISTPRLVPSSGGAGAGSVIRFLAVCGFILLLVGSLLVTALVGLTFLTLPRIPHPVAPAPIYEQTPRQSPSPTPAPRPATFADQVADSQRRAAAKYPELGKAASASNLRFRVKLEDWRARGDVRLSRPDWPERLADEVAVGR